MTDSQIIDFIITAYRAVIIPLIFGIIVYKKMRVRERAFFYLILSYALMTILQNLTHQSNNIYTIYLGRSIEVILASWALYLPFLSKKTRPFLVGGVSLLVLITISEGLLVSNGFEKYNSVSQTLMSIFLIGLALYSLIKLRKNEMVLSLSQEPFFWFALYIAIFHAGNIVTFATEKAIMDASNDLLLDMAFIKSIIYVLGLILMCIGLWQIKKRPTSSSIN